MVSSCSKVCSLNSKEGWSQRESRVSERSEDGQKVLTPTSEEGLAQDRTWTNPTKVIQSPLMEERRIRLLRKSCFPKNCDQLSLTLLRNYNMRKSLHSHGDPCSIICPMILKVLIEPCSKYNGKQPASIFILQRYRLQDDLKGSKFSNKPPQVTFLLAL